MEQQLQVFQNFEFGKIRAIERNCEPWFVGKDVATALGYVEAAKAIREKVDDEDKGVSVLDTPGGRQQVTIINESGLYSLIMSSQLPTAKKFKRWVTNEVLPAIRKTGGYIVARENETPSELMARAIIVANNTIKKRDERIKALENENASKRAQLEQQRSKVAFADALTASTSSCLIGEHAKLIRQAAIRQGKKIEIGQNRLFQWLRDKGFIGRDHEYYNIANQKYIEQGLFELKKTIHDENGIIATRTTTKITCKGQSYFINGFLNGKFTITEK